MNRRKMLWTTILTALVSMFLIGMGFDSNVRADDDRGPRTIEGSWRMTVTALNPPGLQPFESLMTFVPGGGLVETRRLYVADFPTGSLLETPGAGNWDRVGLTNSFDVTFIFLLQGGPNNVILNGAPFGTDKIRWKATFNRRTGELAGPWQSTIVDETGVVVFAASGTLRGRRIPLEPL